jgi:hypothetical protein
MSQRIIATTVQAAALAAAAAALVACGSAAGTTAPATGSPPPAVTTAGPGAVQKVSANDATETQIGAALRAAGVPNAERWADEVVEYRPYPADDAQLGKLRTSLAKYNPAPGVVDAIVAVLRP